MLFKYDTKIEESAFRGLQQQEIIKLLAFSMLISIARLSAPQFDMDKSYLILNSKSLLKGTLMQIWKSPYIFKFI